MGKLATRKRQNLPGIAEFKVLRIGDRIDYNGVTLECVAVKGGGNYRMWDLISEHEVRWSAVFTGGHDVTCGPYGLV